jgi:hypothetical protein
MRLGAFQREAALAEAGEDAGAVDPGPVVLAGEAELDRVPVEARDPLQCAHLHRREAELAQFLHEIGDLGQSEEGDVAEHVVKDIRLLQIIELRALADEIAGGEAALAEMVEEDVLGDEARNGDHDPAGARAEPRVEVAKFGDARPIDPQHVQPFLEGADVAAGKRLLLPLEEDVPDRMLLSGQRLPILGDGPVGRGAGRRMRRVAGGAVALGNRGGFVQHL